MIKTIRVMLIPNYKQLTRLFQFAGSARYAYNWALEQEKKNHETGGKFINDYELRKRFTVFKNEPENRWLYTVSNNVCKQAIKDAVIAYKKFFKGLAEYPKHKSGLPRLHCQDWYKPRTTIRRLLCADQQLGLHRPC